MDIHGPSVAILAQGISAQSTVCWHRVSYFARGSRGKGLLVRLICCLVRVVLSVMGGKGTGSGSKNEASGTKEWTCKWCYGPDGGRLRNGGERKACRSCTISKCYAYHFQPAAPSKPSTSMAERQIAAEKADNRKQFVAQRKRIEHLEKQLAAKASDLDSGSNGLAEGVNPSKLVSKQQRAQKLLAEVQAEGLLGSLDISSMPWTKVVVPKALETAESLHREAKGKYDTAFGRWKRGSVAVEEANALVATLEEQLEAARGVLLRQEVDFKGADLALSEAAKLVELAAAKREQEKADKTDGEKDEQMPGPAGPGKKKTAAGPEEKELLQGFQEELLASVRGDTSGGQPSDETTRQFIEKCSSLFLNLQKLVAGQRAAAAVPVEPALFVGAVPRGRTRSRSRSPLREERAASLPPREADCL